jgi:hypothetical protein
MCTQTDDVVHTSAHTTDYLVHICAHILIQPTHVHVYIWASGWERGSYYVTNETKWRHHIYYYRQVTLFRIEERKLFWFAENWTVYYYREVQHSLLKMTSLGSYVVLHNVPTIAVVNVSAYLQQDKDHSLNVVNLHSSVIPAQSHALRPITSNS